MLSPIVIDDDEVEFLEKANSILNNNYDEDDKYYYAKKSKRDNVIGPWLPCELLEKVGNGDGTTGYIVQFIRSQEKKDIAEYELAYRTVPTNELYIGTRVIARRCRDLLPYQINQTGQKNNLLDSNDAEFYPGIITGADTATNRYLTFFDDGMVQLIALNDIRRVVGNDSCNHAHWNAKQYFDWFLRNERLEIRPKIGQILKVELNGNCEAMAKVLQVDSMLAQIHFEKENRFEWIYLGSPRISQIYRELVKTKRLDNIIQFKTYNTSLSANDDVVMFDFVHKPDDEPNKNYIEPPSVPVIGLTRSTKHDCCHSCVRSEDKFSKIEQYPALLRPILLGWKRSLDKRYYVAPCGKSLHSLNDVDKFLFLTDSKLRIDCFDFSKNCDIPSHMKTTVAPNHNIAYISRGIESIAIGVCDQMSLEDRSFNYTKSYIYDYIDEPKKRLGRTGCDCLDNCRDKLKCSCWHLTVQRSINNKTPKDVDYRNNVKVGYKDMRLEKIVYTGIVECSSDCECCASTCVNRVLQNGIQFPIEIFMTRNKGWGVRAASDIPEGMFVCSYAGDLLDDSVADKRSTKFQFKLPKFQIDSDESDSDFDDEPAKRHRTKSHDVIQPFLNYFSEFLQNGNANHFPEPERKSNSGGYVVDALYNGNVSRFINHSCDPNLFVQSVYVDEDTRFPKLGFFSSEIIKAGTELTIDYGYELIDGEETECLCGSGDKCRKRLT